MPNSLLIFFNKDKIKLCANRFQTRQSRPEFVTVGSAGTGGVLKCYTTSKSGSNLVVTVS